MTLIALSGYGDNLASQPFRSPLRTDVVGLGVAGSSSLYQTPIGNLTSLLFPGVVALIPSGGDDGPILSALTAPAILVGGQFQINSMTTVSQDIVVFGATIHVQTGFTLAFHAAFSAPIGPLFLNATAGLGSVTFSSGLLTTGYAEWWGALKSAPTVDCSPAINACIAAVPVTQLQAGAYFCQAKIVITANSKTLQGVAPTQQPTSAAGLGTLSTTATQIVLTYATGRGLQVGYDQNTQPAFNMEFVTIADLAIVRATAALPYGVSGATPIANPATGTNQGNWSVEPPSGLWTKYIVNCHFNRVMVIENSNGFYIGGCIESYWENCSSLRYTTGVNSSNDYVTGFYLDYSVTLAANGGNASIYLDKCRAFCGVASPTYSSGATTYDGFVDTWITQLETGGQMYGIDAQGDGVGSTSFRTEDFFVRGCILDGVGLGGIRVGNAGIYSAITLDGNYVGESPNATGIILVNIAGSVTVSNNQVICGASGTNAGTGLAAVTVQGLNSIGNIYTTIQQPIFLSSVQNFIIQDNISSRGLVPTPLYPGVGLLNCTRGRIALSIKGTASTLQSGVNVDTGSTHVEVNCSAMNPTSFTAAANKIWYNGVAWGGGTTFGTGNVATGDLT